MSQVLKSQDLDRIGLPQVNLFMKRYDSDIFQGDSGWKLFTESCRPKEEGLYNTIRVGLGGHIYTTLNEWKDEKWVIGILDASFVVAFKPIPPEALNPTRVFTAEEVEEARRLFKNNYKLVSDEPGSIKDKGFKKGDIIHTIDFYYITDEYGNDIDQNHIYINTEVIVAEYEVECWNAVGYNCRLIKDKYGRSEEIGSYCVGPNLIYENYEGN